MNLIFLAEALATRLSDINNKISALQYHESSSTSSEFGLDSVAALISPPSSVSELSVLTTKMNVLTIGHKELQLSIGQDMMIIESVKFESLPQSTAWFVANLSSRSYHVFTYMNTFLDVLDSSHMSDKEFIDEKYHA